MQFVRGKARPEGLPTHVEEDFKDREVVRDLKVKEVGALEGRGFTG